MIIQNFNIRNFKSFGNNLTTLTLNPNVGELILLQGINGAGKSSILEAVDFTLYGKVRGKKKKFVTLDSLPNRYNKNLDNSISFTTDEHHIEIKRSLSPSKLELYVNGDLYDRAGKANVQSKIEEIVGIDLNTFKSFISMSINDFKNFMVLDPDEKRMLLDRLFNLEMINELSKIIKEKKKQNVMQVNLCNAEINSFESSLDTFKGSVAKLKASAERNVAAEKDALKELVQGKKVEYDALKEQLDKAAEKDEQIQVKMRGIRDQLTEANYQLTDSKKKTDLYQQGKCPTCSNDWSGQENFEQTLEQMRTVHAQLTELVKTLRDEYAKYETAYIKFKGVVQQRNTAYTELRLYLVQVKNRITALGNADEDQNLNESITEIISAITKIEQRKDKSLDKLSDSRESGLIIEQLNKVFSEEGIKKSIISKIVVPLNHFIKENVAKLGLPFTVELDDQFTAAVSIMGDEIDVDSLSTGETKLVNLAVMFSYLRLIRMKKHINLLFLDEVFSSIDVENIYLVLDLLKDFAREYNINIFLIHHAMLEKSYFDRIMRIEKNITSLITEE